MEHPCHTASLLRCIRVKLYYQDNQKVLSGATSQKRIHNRERKPSRHPIAAQIIQHDLLRLMQLQTNLHECTDTPMCASRLQET